MPVNEDRLRMRAVRAMLDLEEAYGYVDIEMAGQDVVSAILDELEESENQERD